MSQRSVRAGHLHFRRFSPPQRQRAPPIKRAGQFAFTPISHISHYNLYREVGSSSKRRYETRSPIRMQFPARNVGFGVKRGLTCTNTDLRVLAPRWRCWQTWIDLQFCRGVRWRCANKYAPTRGTADHSAVWTTSWALIVYTGHPRFANGAPTAAFRTRFACWYRSGTVSATRPARAAPPWCQRETCRSGRVCVHIPRSPV